MVPTVVGVARRRSDRFTRYNRSVTVQANDQKKRAGEPRLPAACAVLVAIALYALLPEPLLIGPRLVVPTLELVLFIPLMAANPRRMNRQNRLLRNLSISLVLLIALANVSSLVLLVLALVSGQTMGAGLLLGAAQVWLTNVLVFALASGSSTAAGRSHGRDGSAGAAGGGLPVPAGRGPRRDRRGRERSAAKSGWAPGFIDYLYVSVTNSSAFSPTDTMPLSPRAKMLMAVESVSALLLSILVISLAISLLK